MPTNPAADIELRLVQTASDLEAVRVLLLDYQASMDVDLCFQGFDTEIENLPGEYVEPSGLLVLALVDDQPAGCCALRPLLNSDHVNACEMKRLYVRPAFRGFGLGERLVKHVMMQAQMCGYATILLDTLSDMETARTLYQDAGFVEVAPYYHNPLPGAHYLMADLNQIHFN